MSPSAAGADVTDDGAALHVDHDGTTLLSYTYRPQDAQLESPRPYAHPVRTLGGRLVTLLRPHDHVWHKGIAWSLPYVGPWNFWGGPTFVRDQGYVQLDNDGTVGHESFGGPADAAAGTVVEDLLWRTPPTAGAEVVVRERRTQVVSVPGAQDAWVLTFRSVMTNVSATDLPLGSPTTNGRDDAGYGGLFWRGPRSFTGGTVLAPGHEGGEHVRGQRFGWMGFTGRHDGTDGTSTVVMVDPGTNPGGVPRWFVRSDPFACLCPAPAFAQELPFDAGSTLTFDYAVVVADGASSADRGEGLAELGRAALGSVGDEEER